MTYDQALNYIHSLNRFGIKPGLERIQALMECLDNPQKGMQFIHIAGTNGKGSTSTAISNIMISAGKKTGLFISPFVVDFRERIQINGRFISKEDLASLTEKVAKFLPKVKKLVGDDVTEFEFITAVAFLYFKEQSCDMVVLETGLGGRLDSTNIIENPLVNVITKIDLDHTAVLGNTVEEIALEKCGIIKCGANVVTSSTQNKKGLKIIEDTALKKKAKLYIASRQDVSNIKTNPFGVSFIYKGMAIETKMPGIHQVENMTTAAETALCLGIDKDSVIKGIGYTSFPARLEVISKEPLVLLDGAHNENGADVLCDYLDEHNLKPVIVLGMMRDKNCVSVVQKLSLRARSVITVTVKSNDRAETAERLGVLANENCQNVYCAETYEEAISMAEQRRKSSSVPLLVCGSLYLASDIRQSLINKYKK
ncbi:MAG: bifunctional folylpolyglutamate synthase/dihydrofolate synthase [Clostridia bacterium]|nr:bifunctional folylpolyglutamate synthase/dihydrofolate synthase [Clostridia bacterium]